MDISYNWLKDLIDFDIPASELAEKLTRVGLTVEGVHPVGDDEVLDIDLTSNRPDCLSHLGVAREIGVISNSTLKVRGTNSGEEHDAIPVPALLAADTVRIEDAEICPRFTARVLRNVKIGPSPVWLVKRLEAAGERSINNVTDITNYVMLELGQPMHAFDLDRLAGQQIVVRRARAGETIKTLDDIERILDSTMLAICDAQKPVAVAGIMGGLDSSITDATVNVLLEVACFDRENIRRTSRKLGLATEASYRFERGVDIEKLKAASQRAADLIGEFASGAETQFVDVYPSPASRAQVIAPEISASVARLTGLAVDDAECERILASLGIKREGIDHYSVPSWRHDISVEEDLVEEIARHTGYENIQAELPPAYGAGEYKFGEVRKRLIRQCLVDLGFDEAISYSFIDSRYDDAVEAVPGLIGVSEGDTFVTLNDSVIEGAVRMRPTLIPGMLEAFRLNLNHQRRDVKLFEIGRAFARCRDEGGLPKERELSTLLLSGGEIMSGRAAITRELDFYDAKGAVEALFAAVGITDPEFAGAEVRHLRRGQSATVSVDGRVIGTIGRLNEEISSDYKFRQPVYVAEIDLQAALESASSAVIYRPLSKYPSITRDVSFLVDRNISLAAIRSAASEVRNEICRNIGFVDIFEGKGLADNERSITIRFEYRSDDRTLVEEEVNAAHQVILDGLKNALGIKPRF